MFKDIGNQVQVYFSLLWEKPPKPVSKRKLRKLKRKEKKQAALRKKPTENLSKRKLRKLKKKEKKLDKFILKTKEAQEKALALKPEAPPEISVCMNCGHPLQGKFCFNCGQKDSDYRRPYWTFLEDFSDNIFSRDSRLWRTLGFLLFLPGAMTRDFIAGKRIRFLPPIRLFLVSIILFFLTISVLNVAIVKFIVEPVTPELIALKIDGAVIGIDISEEILERTNPDAGVSLAGARKAVIDGVLGNYEGASVISIAGQDGATETRVEIAEGTEPDFDFDIKMFAEILDEDVPISQEALGEFIQLDTVEAGDPDEDWTDIIGRKVERGLKAVAEDPRRLNNSLNNWVPITMAIFIPMFAFFLRFFYWKREQYFFNHLIFSLHFHTYIFFVLTFFVLAQVFVGAAASTWMFLGAVPLYLLVALKVATGNGWIRSFFKFSIISIFYIFGFSVMIGIVFIASLAEA